MVRTSDREIVTTRTMNAPARLVFEAWTKPDLFVRWWVPKSAPISLRSFEADVRVGGKYRLEFAVGAETMPFFGKYLEVTPHSRLAWTNDEGGDDVAAITTVTFEERDGKTLLTMSDLHPSKEALDATMASGSCDGTPESWDQLAEVLANLQAPQA